jgi:dihydropteroate synthase
MFGWSSVCAVRPAVMGVVNVTPDSFSDGGRYLDPGAAVAHGLALVDAGADVLDIGGESTRPGATAVDAREELRRVLPVVERLAVEAGVPMSIDTSKAQVAAAALGAGARIVNDVSAGTADADMFRVVSEAGAGYVVMHMQGDPQTMQRDPRYGDVVTEVGDFLVDRLSRAREAGIADDALCADPGIGFGKRPRHSLEILARLREIVERCEVPVLVGTSRKSFIGAVLGYGGGGVGGDGGAEPLPVQTREDGTLATVVWAVDHGARVVRVHDVRPAAESLQLLSAMHGIDAAAVA